jgi:hypothetical protein
VRAGRWPLSPPPLAGLDGLYLIPAEFTQVQRAPPARPPTGVPPRAPRGGTAPARGSLPWLPKPSSALMCARTSLQFYPVKGWKRYKGTGGFEFRYPVEWLQARAPRRA